MNARTVRLLGPAIVVVLAATLSGCGEGDAAEAASPAASLVPLVVVTPTPIPPAAATPTPKAVPKATPKASPKASPKATPKAAPASTAPAGDVVKLDIKNFAFMPMTINLKVGQTLVVTNLDDAAHTITADDGSFNSGNLAKGQSFTWKATKAGTYSYFCDYHQYMTGTIEVS